MNTAQPATRPPHTLFKLGPYSVYMLFPGLRPFNKHNPAYPLIPRQRRQTLPHSQSRLVVSKNLF
jgi:hypothetical protein